MTLTTLCAMTLVGFVWAVVSGKFKGTSVTGPMAMMISGVLIAFLIPGAHLSEAVAHQLEETIHVIAEITLIIVLFSDASHISATRLKQDMALPSRLLLLALPLIIVFGAIVAILLFPSLGFAGALLLAAILAPTDAALGQSVVSNAAVPEEIRLGLEVESGLNDGIALFVVLVAMCMVGWTHGINSGQGWLIFGITQVMVGCTAGAVAGWLGAKLVGWADTNACLTDSMRGAAGLALAGFAWALAELLSGNGFIAAFVAGLVYGHQARLVQSALSEFVETEGQLLILGTFLLFGYALLPEALAHVSAATFVYALLSLVVIRTLAVGISLMGLGMSAPSALFVGWFGPRGLASIVFALFAANAISGDSAVIVDEVVSIVYVAVGISVLLHGITAAPLSRRFATSN